MISNHAMKRVFVSAIRLDTGEIEAWTDDDLMITLTDETPEYEMLVVQGLSIGSEGSSRRLAKAKMLRNEKLANSDARTSPDVPEQLRSLWITYRVALRDITTQDPDPRNWVWPTPPN
jgi:hypothetical protein